MSVSEALKTTFKGDGPTTQVIVPLAVAEADHGSPFETDEVFAKWIDDNNDRIYASAAAKRETAMLYETVTLAEGDLQAMPPVDVSGLEEISTSSDEEARVVLSGEPVEGADPLFVGRIHDAIEYVLAKPADQSNDLEIWTAGRVYGVEDLDRFRQARQARSEP